MAYTDDFNRSNETPLSTSGNWSLDSAASNVADLVSNEVYKTTSGDGIYLYDGGTFDDNQYAQITVASSSAAVGVVVRRTSGSGGYYWVGQPGNSVVNLYKTGALFHSVSCGWTTGDVLRIEVTGSYITGWKNGVLQAEHTDTSFTTNYPGFIMGGSGCKLDDFEAGNMPLQISVADCGQATCVF